jgi:putative tricarboxylic transport membrane protein
MDFLHNIALGFSILSQPTNIFLCFLGVLLGTLVGVLPGLGPAAAIALLLPITFRLTPEASIIMLAGIYYGSKYGGSTTAILLNLPGEADSVVTCFDGYQMARQGRAGPALGIAAFGSFIAGTIGVIGLMLIAPSLAAFALRFGPPEIFSLMCAALTLLIYLASGSPTKAIITAGIGAFLGTIGQDIFYGKYRFTFGITSLYDGIGIIPVIMGMFGITEVFENIEKGLKREIFKTRLSNLLPSLKDWRDSIGAILRGTFLGFFVGLLPGGGSVLSTLASYSIEKRLSKHPERFGKGAIAGVAGPESANNATTASNFIPLMTLGIPCNSVMAILFAALLISGLSPGPLLIKENPSLFWGVIASMYVGNVMLLALNLPLIGLWVRFLRIPYEILFPLVLFMCVIGSYTVANNVADVIIMIIFGVLGYLMRKFEYETAPLVMTLVLTSQIEDSMIRSLRMSGGSFLIFFERPISLIFMLIAFFLLITSFLRKKRVIRDDLDD